MKKIKIFSSFCDDNICKDRQITLADFDYFDIVSELDATVSKEFLALSINNL